MSEAKIHLLKTERTSAHEDVLTMLEKAVEEIKESKSENVLLVYLASDDNADGSPVNLHVSATSGLNQIALATIAKECLLRGVIGL